MLIKTLRNEQLKEKYMNRTELFNEVKSWLEAGKITFVSTDESMFRLHINADNGLFDLRLLCEEEPAMLQVCCPIQVRIPEQKVAEASLLLHNLNTCLRIGAFQFHVEDRVLEFRLTMPIQPDGELAKQFGQTLGTVISTMDEHIRTLGLLACSMPEAQKAVAKLTPRRQTGDTGKCLQEKRFELN